MVAAQWLELSGVGWAERKYTHGIQFELAAASPVWGHAPRPLQRLVGQRLKIVRCYAGFARPLVL